MLQLYFCNLISNCLNAQLEIKLGKLETKVGKLPVIASYTCSFNSNYLGAKIWRIFAELYQNSTNCFLLEFTTVRKKIKIHM